MSSNVVSVVDNTRLSYDLDEIAKENNLKGLFVKKMLKEMNEHKEKKEIYRKAIDYVISAL